jgi:prevent-host-death family protein
MTTKLTSREFNQDTAGAKRAADTGPVYITDRGRPSHVLLAFEDYRKLAAVQPTMIELLSDPTGVADVEFEVPRQSDVAEPARFD